MGQCGRGLLGHYQGWIFSPTYRGNRVGEIPGIFSYSASGSYDYFSHDGSTQTPQDAMAKELKEELGVLETNTADAVRLIALGIDTERYLIQFSYLWECPYTAQELNMQESQFCFPARKK